jgi:decaprenylphospho-beta-D-erythro-pentofuranosid-2-ulose 2-reductase
VKDSVGAVQSALVLGGTSEIARATLARLVAARTRTVVLAGRHPAALDPVAAELRSLGASTVATLRFDATDFDAHDAFADDAWAAAGGEVDLVMLAFGVLGDQEQAASDRARAVEVIETNFTGAVSVAIPITRRLVAQGHGQWVVLSTVAGERVRRSNLVYGAAKAGLDGYFGALGDRLAGTGVGVLVVRPGFVHTRMTAGMPAAPLATTAEAVALDIVRGLERGRETVWSPAALRPVMSVLRHVPRPIFRRLPL